MKVDGQVSLIGGTMGLLTGFSIISRVEIVYFAAKAFTGIIAKQVEEKKDLQRIKICQSKRRCANFNQCCNHHVLHGFM